MIGQIFQEQALVCVVNIQMINVWICNLNCKGKLLYYAESGMIETG
jgi:hypothetical protein